jgi:hypothetical protein
MNEKRVAQHLRKKFNDWVASIKDKELREEVAEDAIITGGCIASLLLGEKVNDYDIYFKSICVAEDVAKYYIAEFNNNSQLSGPGIGTITPKIEATQGEDGECGRVKIYIRSAGVAAEGDEQEYAYFETDSDEKVEDYIERTFAWKEDAEGKLDRESEEKPPYRPVFITSNAITLSDKIQLVLRFVGSPSKIHENYDFVHCKNYWTAADGKLHLKKDSLSSLLTKTLVYTGSKYPVCSLFRLRKFLARGWTITAGQILKIALQVSDLDLNNAEVLEDQLIGVDVAYFAEVLDLVKKGGKTIPGLIDRAYLLQVIDRMF